VRLRTMSSKFSKDDEEDWNAIFCARDTEDDEVEPLEAESDEEGSEISSLLDSDDEEPLSGFEVDSEEEAVHLTDQVTRYVLPPHTIFIPLIITWF